MKIVILDGHAVNPGDLSWDFLNKYGEVTVYERTKLDEVAKRIGDAEIVLTNKSPINEEILSACPNIKLCVCWQRVTMLWIVKPPKSGASPYVMFPTMAQPPWPSSPLRCCWICAIR